MAIPLLDSIVDFDDQIASLFSSQPKRVVDVLAELLNVDEDFLVTAFKPVFKFTALLLLGCLLSFLFFSLFFDWHDFRLDRFGLFFVLIFCISCSIWPECLIVCP